MDPNKNIVLIGFMGTGKSTVGKRLAKSLDWKFVDTDVAIEELTGLSVVELFRLHGETRFRSEEALLVQRLSEQRGCVFATGGGTVLNSENWAFLAQHGVLVQLYATVETILERVGARPNTRPLLKGSRERIEALWQARQEIYARADMIVDTTDKDVDEVAGEILSRLEGQEDGSRELAKD
ncbi:MAG: shikimate kinase [Desulfitobacteriaceae bacterium]|nr:shikimate kinase [Desulfitobacteriaceae bacterium]MDI6878474.1 shikimate kinase [Desulfitobacteriaceae bacterium]MDI6913007.1 shikimate kinase [Desulfitobacteriaceae bacterium]